MAVSGAVIESINASGRRLVFQPQTGAACQGGRLPSSFPDQRLTEGSKEALPTSAGPSARRDGARSGKTTRSFSRSSPCGCLDHAARASFGAVNKRGRQCVRSFRVSETRRRRLTSRCARSVRSPNCVDQAARCETRALCRCVCRPCPQSRSANRSTQNNHRTAATARGNRE